MKTKRSRTRIKRGEMWEDGRAGEGNEPSAMPESGAGCPSRGLRCCPGLRAHPATRSDACDLLPDPARPGKRRSPAQPSEGQKTILSLCQALGKLPPPPPPSPTHPVHRFVSGLGIPGTSARLPRPTAHLRVRTCSAGCAPVPPARRSPRGAHPRRPQAPPAPHTSPATPSRSPGAKMFRPRPVPLGK